jgi:hypothetical protein
VIAAVTIRTLRSWIVAAALAAVLTAAALATPLAYLLAGFACIGGSVFLVRLDGLGKRGRSRR